MFKINKILILQNFKLDFQPGMEVKQTQLNYE